MISTVMGIRSRWLPFLGISSAISVHVLIGCQWLAMAFPNRRRSFSVYWMGSVSCGYAIRLIFTCFCCVVVFVVNVDVLYQYRTTWVTLMNSN